MKELSIEEKAKRYDKALEIAREWYNDPHITIGLKGNLEDIFPELKESEDERIRKALISFLQLPHPQFVDERKQEKWIAWLEKQGEQKHSDKVNPRFKVGDWVVTDKNNVVQIKAIENGKYVLENTMRFTVDYVDKCWRKWSIQDAKDGDVLAAHECVVLFKEIDGLNIKCHCTYHFMNNPSFYVNTLQNKRAFHPATEEQQDLLFQKIKEADYEWDAEKKELKKIKQKSTQETKPFEVEHGKYYYCIKDYFCGGKKQASKGDVIQALRGLPIMGIKDASEYFLPVNFIKEIW